MMRNIFLAGILLVVLSCQNGNQKFQEGSSVLPEKEVVFEGLNRPWSIAFLSENSALVTEKNGDLVRINLIAKTKHRIKGFPKDLTDSIGVIHIGVIPPLVFLLRFFMLQEAVACPLQRVQHVGLREGIQDGLDKHLGPFAHCLVLPPLLTALPPAQATARG